MKTEEEDKEQEGYRRRAAMNPEVGGDRGQVLAIDEASEDDKEWAEELKLQLPPNVDLHYVPWDAPRTIPTQRSQFETYISHVDTLGVDKFDKVLIDGRARGWCAEYVLKYLHKDSIIFMHDFWERPQYHVVFEWYDEVDSVKDTLQTIVALKPKKQYIND